MTKSKRTTVRYWVSMDDAAGRMSASRELSSCLKHPFLIMPFNLTTRFPIARWVPIPLRFIVGYGFMAHGFAKLSRGPEAFAVILHAIGTPMPHFMAWVTILAELLGGLAVLLGAFV